MRLDPSSMTPHPHVNQDVTPEFRLTPKFAKLLTKKQTLFEMLPKKIGRIKVKVKKIKSLDGIPFLCIVLSVVIMKN